MRGPAVRVTRWVVERFFPWLYTRGAWAYDMVAWLVSGGRWTRWVQAAAARVPPDARVLELGSGPGHALAFWARRGQRAWGVDASPVMVRRAAARVRRHGGTPQVVLARGQALPWPANSVDWVLATFPAPYIAEARTASEVARVLRPGGHVLMLLSAQSGLLRLWERLVRWAWRIDGLAPAEARYLARCYRRAGLEAQAVREPLPDGSPALWLRGRKPAA